MNKAVFFDRDGVLIKDIGLLTEKKQIVFPEDIFQSLAFLKNTNFKLIVVTNQAVIARGMADEKKVEQINDYIADTINERTGRKIDKFYFCPHHPNADVEGYRINCECRKPKPGMLLTAANEFNIDLARSYMIGDRLSDIIAGAKAGCKTILIETGRHEDPPIESDAYDLSIEPDHICKNLTEAVNIINHKSK